MRDKAKKAGLWAPQSPKEYGGMDLPIVAWAVMYEEAARSLFGPLAMNCMAPDDGNMNVLKKLGTPRQKDKWLKPIVEGKVRSSFAMTEPAPGGGSDPSMIKTYAEKHGDTWKIYGRKWFITGADGAAHFILAARTSDDKRKGITTFLFHKDQPGWRIVRRIEIMGPEEHGGHCELEFDGLEVHDDDVFGGLGNGLKVVQVRLGPARLTHCMRWLGWSKRCVEIAQEYVDRREGFGIKLADRESVQMKLGEVGHNIHIGRLLTMHAAWKLDQGDYARKEVSMAKLHCRQHAAPVSRRRHPAQRRARLFQGHHRRMGLSRRPRRAPRRRRRRGAQDGAGEIHARRRPRFLELERGKQSVEPTVSAARRKSAVDREHRAGDEIRCRTRKKHSGAGHVVRFAPAAGRRARQDTFMQPGNLLACAFGQIGVDPAGQNDVDLDIVGRPGGRERARQRHHAALARGVGRDDRCTEQRIHRPDIDNFAVPGRFHVRIDGLRAEQRAAEIDVEHFAPFGFGNLLGPLADRRAGIVDENVATAEIGNDGLDHVAARCRRRRLQRIEPAANSQAV